jgi:hypothetical protein
VGTQANGQNILYAPRSAIKSQVLADFITEWTEIQTPLAPIEHETWILYFDGSVMKDGAGVGLVFISSLGVRMEYMVLTVDYRIKVHMDLQANKSPVVVKGPFFPRVVNPRYRIRGTMCNARIQSSKAR